MTHKMDRQKR